MSSLKNGQIISFINMKGGVGKTTLSIGVADYLANVHEEKKKILIIDVDPQFNATQALLDAYYSGDYFADVLPLEKTINKLFRPQVDFREGYSSPTKDSLIISLTENLDIICGDLNLVLANKSSDYTHVKRLRRFINDNRLREIYDLIIIDCPPTLTIYTDSALLASDYYLIPNRIDRYSIIGISSLQKAIRNLTREEEKELNCIGLVYTMREDTLSQKQERMKASFEEKEDVEGVHIFTGYSCIVKDLQVGLQGPIPTKYKRSLEDIRAVSYELLLRLRGE
ncbi:AAA family ATPase [Paenibacillus sp. 2003]|uniref:ParA family protein n=1 Tax=Paenibacillus sp. 2003 TaxID=2817761 RepID=UPI0028672BC0|nr:AAA family ATPase [Paenibacillus sp. 2003]MDR6720881.1 chromosome partitioning protein [Paenibacillus sp. 2003]